MASGSTEERREHGAGAGTSPQREREMEIEDEHDNNETIGILPVWEVGFAQMLLIWWASLKCSYETMPF